MGKKRMANRVDDLNIKMIGSSPSSPSHFSKKSLAKVIADITSMNTTDVCDTANAENVVEKEKTIAEILIEKKNEQKVAGVSKPKSKKQKIAKPPKPLKASTSVNPVEASSSNPLKSTKGKKRVVESPPSKQTGVFLKKQKVDKRSKKDVEYVQSNKTLSVRIRTTPKALFTVLNNLKEGQKEVLRSMGFGSLIGMKMDEISGSLGYFVVKKFDPSENVLKLSTGDINITRQVVHDILGIPMGNIDLFTMPAKEIKGGELSGLTVWRKQFGSSIRPSNLCSIIVNSDDTGLLFKLNFLILFVSTMIFCDGSGGCAGSVQTAICNHISDDTSIAEIDWCGYLLSYLGTCKNNWQPNDKTYFFTGPMTFLQMLYVDSTNFQRFPITRERPAISYLNSQLLNKRVKLEIEEFNGFGKVPLHPPFSASAPEVPEKLTPTSVEDFHASLESLFSSLLQGKMQIEETLKDALAAYPSDVKFLEFEEKFMQLFGVAKPAAYVTSNQKLDNDDDYDEDVNNNVDENKDDDDDDDDDAGGYVGDDDNIASDLNDGSKEDVKVDAAANDDAAAENNADDVPSSSPNANFAIPNEVIPSCSADPTKLDYDSHSFLSDDEWFNDPAFQEVFDKIDNELLKRKPPSFPSFENLTPPSFSLISQEYSSPVNCVPFNALNMVSPEPAACFSSEKVPVDEPATMKQKRTMKRLSKPSKFYSSPYMNADTEILTAVTSLEWVVSGSLFIMKGDCFETVFESSSGHMIHRLQLESLAPSVMVYSNVIDIWSFLLNEEQKKKYGVISKLFLNTSVVSESMFNGTFDIQKSFEIFEMNLLASFSDDLHTLSMQDVDLVFFPIIVHEHYYLIVFNLKRVAFNVIDNSAAIEDYQVKYEKVGSVIHYLFSKHLEVYGHHKASTISKAKPNVLKMKWKTLHNHIDCGVFVMCHMDTYNGEAVSKWNPGFVTESTKGIINQKMQLTKLRVKYATKIILHELNLHKEKMVALADEFSKVDFDAGKYMINDAVRKRKERDCLL